MLKFSFIALLISGAGALTAAAQPAIFTNLGALSQANDVSADGSLVVGSHTVSGSSQIFTWTAAGGIHDITGASGITPVISPDGGTIGWDGHLWSAANGVTTIPMSTVSAISNGGTTAVGGGQVWRQGVGVTQLQSPASSPSISRFAYGVSADGQRIVGEYSPSNGNGSVATIWDGTTPNAIGGIPGYTLDAVATTITADGTQVFGFGRGAGGYDAFRWTQATGIVGLGVGGAGFNFPDPLDVSADGQVIVGSTFGNAFVWRLGSGPRDLKDVLETDYGLDLSNYTLEQARGLSGDGRTLAGFGQDSTTGQRFGWVVNLPWTIPSPGAATPLFLGGLLAVRRRRA